MLLKFAIEDFIDDRIFRNMTLASINSYKNIPGDKYRDKALCLS